jgi:hypothetical protein
MSLEVDDVLMAPDKALATGHLVSNLHIPTLQRQWVMIVLYVCVAPQRLHMPSRRVWYLSSSAGAAQLHHFNSCNLRQSAWPAFRHPHCTHRLAPTLVAVVPGMQQQQQHARDAAAAACQGCSSSSMPPGETTLRSKLAQHVCIPHSAAVGGREPCVQPCIRRGLCSVCHYQGAA